MRERTLTDDQVIEAVSAVRAKSHACTLTALANYLGRPKTTLIHYVHRLKAEGRLAETDVLGSLHVP